MTYRGKTMGKNNKMKVTPSEHLHSSFYPFCLFFLPSCTGATPESPSQLTVSEYDFQGLSW